ncbi:unnamed protein product [Ascophyllum nodosum]
MPHLIQSTVCEPLLISSIAPDVLISKAVPSVALDKHISFLSQTLPFWLLYCLVLTAVLSRSSSTTFYAPSVTLLGLAGRERADAEGSPMNALPTVWSQATDFAMVVRQKFLEYAGSEESALPMIGTGLLVGTLTVCTLYGLSRYFDPDPYLYNGGKMGKLEAQSTHKKTC